MSQSLKKMGMRFGVFAGALCLGLSAPMMVNADNGNDVFDRIGVLEQQTQNLSQVLQNFVGDSTTPPLPVGQEMEVAQSRDIATINLRLQQLEEQIRVLTGQVEGIQFQMTQVYAQIERMNEDNDFRFQQLEGAAGKTDAVAQSNGVTPVGELPQTQNLGQDIVIDPTALDDVETNGSLEGQDFANLSDEPLPLGGQPLVLDGVGTNTVTFSGGAGQALSLDFDPGQLVQANDADAQYEAGFEAVMQGDYDFAIAQFQQFIGLFPDHPLAPEASNWLGESLIQKSAYEDAAEVLFDGFQRHENSTRAPDLLLKLGIALAGAGERDTACRTFVEVSSRYPHMGSAFANRVSEEMALAQC